MRLVLLGTAGYHPNPRRQTLCSLLPECGIMLDAGTGVYRAAEYLTTPELDIFITHAHLDHVIGLSYLFSVNAVLSAAADHAARAARRASMRSRSTCSPRRCFRRGRRSIIGRWARASNWPAADG